MSNKLISAVVLLIIFQDVAVGQTNYPLQNLYKTCSWDEGFSEGKSIYKLMLYDVTGNKYPTLEISDEKKQPAYIELLYENA